MVPWTDTPERCLHEVFGFGAGNQHVGSDPKLELVELLCAAKVLNRNAIAPFLHQSREALPSGFAYAIVGVRDKPLPRASDDVPKEDASRQLRGLDTVGAQVLDGFSLGFAKCHRPRSRPGGQHDR